MATGASDDQGNEFNARHGHELVKADQFVRQEKHAEAILILEELLAKPSNAFIRSMLWINIAIIREQMGRPDDTLRSYDEAIAQERSYNGHFAIDHKACYLAKIARIDESIQLFELLLRRTDLKDEDRVRIQANVAALRREP